MIVYNYSNRAVTPTVLVFNATNAKVSVFIIMVLKQDLILMLYHSMIRLPPLLKKLTMQLSNIQKLKLLDLVPQLNYFSLHGLQHSYSSHLHKSEKLPGPDSWPACVITVVFHSNVNIFKILSVWSSSTQLGDCLAAIATLLHSILAPIMLLANSYIPVSLTLYKSYGINIKYF